MEKGILNTALDYLFSLYENGVDENDYHHLLSKQFVGKGLNSVQSGIFAFTVTEFFRDYVKGEEKVLLNEEDKSELIKKLKKNGEDYFNFLSDKINQ